MLLKDAHLGNIEVRTLPLPDYVKAPSGTYTYSGTVLVDYKREGDSPEFVRLAVTGDDGAGFREIFAGEIKRIPKSNGLRFMVFEDNKRILLGDYVLECSPGIDSCESASLIPVVYPQWMHKDERVMFHWSEIIIAPDNEHICWTVLSRSSAAVMLGRLSRKEGAYVIENIKTFSSHNPYINDPENEGCAIPQPQRGGEVKQFVHGGIAVSMVGGGEKSVLPDPVVVDLSSEELEQITFQPGYEETCIFSPDEKLGMVMSTRGSASTNCAIIGLVPRPYGLLSVSGAIWAVYTLAVSGARFAGKGNVGPALIDINKSMSEPGYMGVLLNDPEQKWVYLSPMSWHPNGTKAMWPEMVSGNPKEKRLRVVELKDYVPSPSVPAAKTPEDIPFASDGALDDWLDPVGNSEVKIAGKHSGFIEIAKQRGNSSTSYRHFSDDGKLFYDGYEKTSLTAELDSVYEACFKAQDETTGDVVGEMNCRLTFSRCGSGHERYMKLLLEPAEDGKPKSYGYARHEGKVIDVASMA
ncbi:MAG: hypothetical protein LBT59_18685 [Clostridiales bacterium]|jgi:hypothetical protein|nr:hypothetical protein [Clostridiales bacterium]